MQAGRNVGRSGVEARNLISNFLSSVAGIAGLACALFFRGACSHGLTDLARLPQPSQVSMVGDGLCAERRGLHEDLDAV